MTPTTPTKAERASEGLSDPHQPHHLARPYGIPAGDVRGF